MSKPEAATSVQSEVAGFGGSAVLVIKSVLISHQFAIHQPQNSTKDYM